MNTNLLLDDELVGVCDSDSNKLTEHTEVFGMDDVCVDEEDLCIKDHENDWFERLIFTVW